MQNSKAFYDLCVPYIENHKELYRILDELYDCGYKTIGIEQIYDHSKKTKSSSDIFPTPVPLDIFQKKYENKLVLLNRLTIIYTDSLVSHAMNNSLNIKKYHLIAGAPLNENAIQHCCSLFSGDIFAMYFNDTNDSTNNTKVSHKYYDIAVRRGMYFEIKYSPALIDSNLRKNILSVAFNYTTNRKAKNIIITSGAKLKFQVRSPYDIANLGLIFGLSEEQSRSAISHICRSLLLRAESRRYGKTIMFARNIPGSIKSSDESDDDDHSDEVSDSENSSDSDKNDSDENNVMDIDKCNNESEEEISIKRKKNT